MEVSPEIREARRLAALHDYHILDTPPEPAFDHITSLVTRLFQVPISSVTLVDADRQWFKSVRGIDSREAPREISFCAHAMWGDNVMVVPDTTRDPLFASNPLVTGEPGLRFYAGAPLRTPEGEPLGALCALDCRPRDFSTAEQQLLSELATLVEDELLLHRLGTALRTETVQRQQAEIALETERRSHRDLAAEPVSQRKKAELPLQQRARQQQAVAELGAKALRSGEVDTLLEAAIATVADTLDLEICQVLEHDPARKALVMRAGLNLAAEKRGKRAGSDNPAFASGHVVRTGEPVIIENFTNEQRFKISRWLRATGAVSGLTVPVGENGSDIPRYGILAAYSRQPREFTEDDVYFVQAVANILAAAISRQRGEDALRVVKARYRRIAANTPGVVYQYLLRPDGQVEIPFISESCRTLYGRDPQEIQSHPEVMLDLVHPEDRPELEHALRAAEQTLTPFHWQGRHLLADGEVRWVRFDSKPERLPDASIICDGIIIDVTEEERQKQALRRSEERFRLANLLAPFPVMLHADDGEVLQVNNSWTHLTGYLPEELATVNAWLRRAHPTAEAQNRLREHLAQLPQHVGAIECPLLPIRCADGRERLWDISSANLGRLSDGRWLHITTAIDVTERHQSEVSLRLAKSEAERANTAKSVFLSRMSHELRTPLNAILGFGQVLELSSLSQQDVQSVEHILNGGRHLLSLIDEVLDLTRVETGELMLRLVAVPLEELAQECVGFVARLAQARGITCTLETNEALQAPVRADAQRLRQVLLNLLSNAIKYNRPGGRVRLNCQRHGSDFVRLRVSDTGSGIAAAQLARLFVPFERLGQEFGEVEGSGLGLVVSRRLVEAMGGSLEVESEIDQGSTFWVELPIAANAAPAEAELASPISGALQVVETAAATVLYIEDNVSNLQVIKTVVERLRPTWRFLSTNDGPNGLQQAREHLPDVILLDLQLPGMKGDEVLGALKTDAITREIPVLLLSADATEHSRERLLALGATDYLSKPFNVRKLLERLDELMRKT